MKQDQYSQKYQKQEFYSEQNVNQNYSEYELPPANSIIDKNKPAYSQQIKFKILEINKQINQKIIISINDNFRQKKKKVTQKFTLNELKNDNQQELLNLNNGYDQNNLLYQKYDNQNCNILNKKKYFASIFITSVLQKNNNQIQNKQNIIKMPKICGMITQQQLQQKISQNQRQSLIQQIQNELQFNSQFQSGNLFAVYKTGNFTYDLILQNDINTIGCTQWFYFQVKNKKKVNFVAKFNIVNFYKSSSLYNQGMKPMARSIVNNQNTQQFQKKKKKNLNILKQKSCKWRRNGHNIFYEKNSLHHQNSHKLYYSLSFCYDFTKQNETVEFAHTIPYNYKHLMEFLSQIQKNSSHKVIIKSIGITSMKNNIPIIKFESQSKNLKINKKSILIMARQHPGQVQGSWAIEQIITQLLKSSTEIQFLLWRFNFYIIPMINVDGVVLGNYRSNFHGYDINRNWEKQNIYKYPQVVFIKRQIKKIMVKYPIELILDLHGHSKKKNSFFYGNPFGPSPFIYPYVASKINQFIKFQDCTFSIEHKQKAKTARSILGNLIKDTGNVFTFQMSFHGGIKNNKLINFYQQHYRQLGSDLLLAMYKVYVQIYKQQKSLKESLYLKQIRKQVQIVNGSFVREQNSDSQIESERQALQNQKKQETQQNMSKIKLQNFQKNNNQKQDLSKSQNLDQIIQKGLRNISQYEKSNELFNQKQTKNLSINRRKKQFSFFNNNHQSLQQKIKKHKLYVDKLKVFGQNYLKMRTNNQSQISIEESKLDKISNSLSFNQQRQRMFTFEQKQKQSFNMNFSYLPNSKRSKNKYSKYFSTINPSLESYGSGVYLSMQWPLIEENSIKEIVKVNRLECRKEKIDFSNKNNKKLKMSIEKNNSINLSYKNKLQKSNRNIFKLPVILNIDKTL